MTASLIEDPRWRRPHRDCDSAATHSHGPSVKMAQTVAVSVGGLTNRANGHRPRTAPLISRGASKTPSTVLDRFALKIQSVVLRRHGEQH